MPIASVSAAELRPVAAADNPAAAILTAAQSILPHLEQGRRVDAAILRGAMEAAFGASDAAGAWDWKTAYDACEAATVLFLRKFGPAIRTRAASPEQLLPLLARVAALLPTHTRRSQESQDLQQFSTPIALALAASTAAAIHNPTWCLSRQPAPACLPCWPSSPAARLRSTNSPRCAAPCLRGYSPVLR
jgi:hypothetical protein